MTFIKRMFILISITMIINNIFAETTTTQSAAIGEGVGAGPMSYQIATNRIIVGNITDINASVKLYDMRIIQLQIHWTDNLPKATTYNVIVTAENSTKCPDPPCHLYGIHKPENFVLMPDNPIISVDPLECNYMFGCNYSVTVETSNTLVARQQKISVPYCIANDTCSCQIRPQPPKVSTEASFPNNATVELSWSLQLNEPQNDKGQNSIKLSSLQFYKMHLTISELSNPLLSWGGKLIPILKETYPLRSLKYTELRHGVQGVFRIPLVKRVAENATLNIHAYIIDNFGCPGEPNVTRVVVPANRPSKYSSRLVTLITVSLLLLCAALAIVWLRKSKRQRRKLKNRREELYLKSFARPMVEMEDNINYVDKYVEQSQALGLADVFEVPHSAIAIGPEIGEGAFGRVFKATALNLRRMRGTTIVAVKQLKRNPNADEIAEFLSEIEMLKGVGTHHNIVCFLGCCTIRAPYLMIMEFVGRGNLLSYLRTVRQEAPKFNSKNVNYTSCKAVPLTKESVKYIELKVSTETLDTTGSESGRRQPKPSFADTTYTIVEDDDEPFEYILDNKELHNFALQIANGMRFLEEQEITHRDLAARNVLIDERKTLKISDFGLSRHGVYTNTKTRKLPLRWLSIEAIRDNVYSSKSDVWAYGVVLWEIGTLGASPYPTISNNELIPFLLEGKRLEKPEICTEQVYAIMLQCWTANPNERPSFDALYKTLSPKTTYVDINKISDDYVFPPIKESNHINY